MSALLPSKIFLTRGQGRHKEKLVSFELALHEAGIAPFNLVRVSSIYPPLCRFVSKDAACAFSSRARSSSSSSAKTPRTSPAA